MSEDFALNVERGCRPLVVPEEQRLWLRRVAIATLASGAAAVLVVLGWLVLGSGGWTFWQASILLCLVTNAPWLGLTAVTGFVGVLVCLVSPDSMAVLPELRRQPPDDAIVAPVR